MAGTPTLSPAAQALYSNQREAMQRNVAIAMTNLTPDKYANFNAITNKYPNMSKDLVMAMVQQGIPADAPGLGKIVSLDGISQLKNDLLNVDKIKSTVKKDRGLLGSVSDAFKNVVYDPFKGVTRAGFALLRYPYDLITTVTRDITAEDDGKSKANQLLKDLATLGGKNTQLGSLVTNFSSQGSGFFISPESAAGKQQAKAMSAYGKIGGDSFTIGRFAAKQLGATPNSTGYKILSGIVDASLNIALDPSTWFGPGAIGKTLGQGKKLKELKAIASPLSKEGALEASIKISKEAYANAQEANKIASQIRGRTADRFLKTESELIRLEETRAATAEKTLNKILQTEEDSFKAFGSDDLAQTVLSRNEISKYILGHDKVQNGELLRGVDRLSAEAKNTGGFAEGYIALDEVPQAGKISIGAHQADEYFVTAVGKEPIKTLDLADDLKNMTGKELQAETNRRQMFQEGIAALASDTKISPEARSVFSELNTMSVNDAMELKGFAWAKSQVPGEAGNTLGSILGKIATTKNTEAMQLATDLIQQIWKVDGFSNIRSIYGQTGGVLITNAKKIAANHAQIGNALAEIIDPTDLGPNMAKLMASLKPIEEQIAKTRTKLAKASAEREAVNKRLKDVALFRSYADQDPELLQKIINDPEYNKLQDLINLNIKVADKDILAEWYRSEVGLTEAFGGELTRDFSKVLKYMLGSRFAEIAEVVAKETDSVKIRQFFGKKLDAEMVNALTKAETSNDVFRIFLEHMGHPETDPQIFKSLALRKEASQLINSPLAKLVEPTNLIPHRYAETIERSINRHFVRSIALPLGDLTRLTNGVEDWISSAQFKLVLGSKGQENLINNTVRKLLASTGEQERAAIIEKMNNDIIEILGNRFYLKGKDIEELKKVIKVSGAEKTILNAYSVGKTAENTVPTIIFPTASNEAISLPGAMHEWQLLNSTIHLPDTKEILKAFTKYETNLIHGKYKAGRVLLEEVGDIWRTAQLAFRISYIWRNIAEMQMRQMFSGHASMFSHPLQFAAMVMANSVDKTGALKSGPFNKLARRVARYQTDLTDQAFRNIDAEGELLDGIRGYQVEAFRGQSVSDYRGNRRSEVFKYYKVVDSNHPEFYKGLSYTLNRFVSDKLNPDIAKQMIAGNEESKKAFVQSLINEFDKPGNVIKEYVTGAFEKNDGIKNIFLKDPSLAEPYVKSNLDAGKIFTFFFDETQAHTLAGQMRAVSGNGPKSHLILQTIADKATPWGEAPMTVRELDALERAFTKKLEKNFTPDDIKGSRVLVENETALGAPKGKEITNLVEKFFTYATRLESKYNFGPEYTMAYWDHVGRYARMLNTDDLKYVQKQAQKTLAPIRTKSGKVLGPKHPVLRVIDSELKSRLKNPNYEHVGGATWQTIHQMSARNASKYVKDLFYDASRQKQWANAFRLIFPFAQAQTNTLYKWSELAFGRRNITPVVRFSKAYQSLTKPGSNVIYDVSGMTYDDNQGFFYKEPGTDKQQFKIPLVGSVIGALAGKNLSMKDALQITAPVQSLNLAFGQVNPLLPGIGPVGQFLFTASGKTTAFGPTYQIFRDMITPYGEPQNISDMLFPSWLKKTFLYRLGDNATVQRGVKDWASYLASTGDYGDNPLADDVQRTRLFHDAESMSREVGVLSALFQSISPATPSTEVLAKIKNPENKMNFMTLTQLYAAWDKFSQANPGDYGSAVRQFAETFGVKNLMIALGSTTTAVRGTDDAWTWLNNNPTAADKYARSPGDVVPYFFPGGEYSLKYYNWQKKTGARTALNANDLANEAEGMIYAMIKSQIAEEQVANMYPNFWYTNKIAELDKMFGAKPPETIVTGTALEKISRIGQALKDPAFIDSPVYKQIAEFYPKYQEFQDILNKLNVSNYAKLTSKGGYATILRNDLVATAERLMLENPSFSRMYYGVFAGQLEG